MISSIRFPSGGRIVIAVSGGSDSTALLTFARDGFSARGEAERLLAVTVDHGLRAESADEAARVGELCASLGIAHTVRRWDGEKPATGVQAAAREARYRLLAEEAAGGIVLTGHTLDDQLETVAMRQARGTGRGLSGIAPATLYERRTWFARPLITHRRAELRHHLQANGLSWIEDPSNRDPAFERVRVRQADVARGDDTGVRQTFAARQAEAQAAAALLRDVDAWQFDAGTRTAEYRPGETTGRAGAELALAIVMSRIGERPNLAANTVMGKTMAFCAGAPSGKRMTASGCLLTRRGETVTIGREARNRRMSGYCYDHLLPSPDFDAAQALAERMKTGAYPNPPVSGYPV